MRALLIIATLFAWSALPAAAQHPIEVQREAAKAEYLKALATYDAMPKRKATNDAIVAAARSAWALGLSQRAIEEFDKVLRSDSLTPLERARVNLSRGIIEFQEERYQVAVLFAQRAAELLTEPSALRARVNLLWAESLYRVQQYGSAEERYRFALAEISAEDAGDAHFLLGRCLIRLGKTDEARREFESVPLGHERTPDSIRHLAQLSFERGDYDNVEFWLAKGREEYPDAFLDSWVEYALAVSAASRGELERMRTLRDDAAKRYPPSDAWLTLLHAASESYEWETRARASLPPATETTEAPAGGIQ